MNGGVTTPTLAIVDDGDELINNDLSNLQRALADHRHNFPIKHMNITHLDQIADNG